MTKAQFKALQSIIGFFGSLIMAMMPIGSDWIGKLAMVFWFISAFVHLFSFYKWLRIAEEEWDARK